MWLFVGRFADQLPSAGVLPEAFDGLARTVAGTRSPADEHHHELTATCAMPYGSESRAVTVTALDPTVTRRFERAVVVAGPERFPSAGNWVATPPKSETRSGPGGPYSSHERPPAASIE